MSKIASKLSQNFAKLGKSNGTTMPALDAPASLRGNNEATDLWHRKQAAAWEFAVAQQLASVAKARYETAKGDAIELGVLSDVEKLSPGQTGLVFDNTCLTIGAKINQPSSRLDKAALVVALTELGVKRDVIDKALDKATKKSSPAQVITCLFKD